MALSKQKFREIVLQLLFSADFEATSQEEMLLFMMKQFAVSRSGMKGAQASAEQIVNCKEAIDAQIGEASTEYSLERIPRVEKAILRLGVYELLHTDLPPEVAIAEALRLCRKYATGEASRFIHAILDKVYKTCTLRAESS